MRLNSVFVCCTFLRAQEANVEFAAECFRMAFTSATESAREALLGDESRAAKASPMDFADGVEGTVYSVLYLPSSSCSD